MAKIDKPATPHSLRHSFATHSFEQGCDIRRIQRALGHVRLETTTIYVNVSSQSDSRGSCIPSPLDHFGQQLADKPTGRCWEASDRPVGQLRIHHRQIDGEQEIRVTLEILRQNQPVYLKGIRASQSRPGFWTLQFPPAEDWNEDLRQLQPKVQARLAEAGFYEMVQHKIVEKLTRQPKTIAA